MTGGRPYALPTHMVQLLQAYVPMLLVIYAFAGHVAILSVMTSCIANIVLEFTACLWNHVQVLHLFCP